MGVPPDAAHPSEELAQRRHRLGPRARVSGERQGRTGAGGGTALAVWRAPEGNMSALLRENEVSTRLGLSVRTLQKWRLEGRGPRFVKLGNAVRYDPADLDLFVREGARRSTSDAGATERTRLRPVG